MYERRKETYFMRKCMAQSLRLNIPDRDFTIGRTRCCKWQSMIGKAICEQEEKKTDIDRYGILTHRRNRRFQWNHCGSPRTIRFVR